MAAPANSIPADVGGSHDVVTSPPTDQQPPARPHARRSWSTRPANLASPSSPSFTHGPAPALVSPYTPLHTGMPAAKRPRKAQAFRDPDVTVQSLNMMEAVQQAKLASESALVQEEEEVRSYTPEGSPPKSSFLGPVSLGDSSPDAEESGAEDVATLDFLGDSTPHTEESDAEDVAQVQAPDTPSKVPAEQDESPTKSARIISGLLSSPAKVHRSPGQLLITQTCWRWCLPGHNLAKCKLYHGAPGKKIVDKEKESSAAEAQCPNRTGKF